MRLFSFLLEFRNTRMCGKRAQLPAELIARSVGTCIAADVALHYRWTGGSRFCADRRRVGVAYCVPNAHADGSLPYGGVCDNFGHRCAEERD